MCNFQVAHYFFTNCVSYIEKSTMQLTLKNSHSYASKLWHFCLKTPIVTTRKPHGFAS